MKAAIYEGIEKIAIKDVPEPKLTDNNIILRVKACAICGTDVRTFHYGKSNVKPPQILGHEVAGEVVAVGRNVKDFNVGDRVAVCAIVPCGRCYYCSVGLQNLCENFTALGYEHPGGFAEYMAVPPETLATQSINKIPEGLSFEEAAIAEPFACVINGQEISKVSLGDKVVIVGSGPIGCMHIVLSKLHGASKVIVVELSSKRLELAKKFRADVYVSSSEENYIDSVLYHTDGKGADVIIIAASSPKAQEESVRIAAPRARINFFGGLPKEKPYVNLDSNIVHYKELTLQGTSGSLPRHNRIAIELFSSGRVNAKDFISSVIPLENIVDGIKLIESGEVLKVVVKP
jgi:L-iditol 2-dehydrogenase